MIVFFVLRVRRARSQRRSAQVLVSRPLEQMQQQRKTKKSEALAAQLNNERAFSKDQVRTISDVPNAWMIALYSKHAKKRISENTIVAVGCFFFLAVPQVAIRSHMEGWIEGAERSSDSRFLRVSLGRVLSVLGYRRRQFISSLLPEVCADRVCEFASLRPQSSCPPPPPAFATRARFQPSRAPP